MNRTSLFALPLLFTLLCATGCPPPQLTCGPGQCEDGKADGQIPEPVLSEAEIDERLAALHGEFEAAAADGLDEGECRAIIAGYDSLYAEDPSVLAARFNVAAVHESCGDADEAEAIYGELGELGHAQSLNNLGVLAWQRGEHGEAFDLFERSVAADRTGSLAARNNLAMALRERYAEEVEAADFERAEVELRNVLAVDSANKAAYENLARLYYDRGRLDDPSYLVLANLVVVQALRVLEEDGEHSADLHNLRGLLLMAEDNQVHALRAFQRAVEIEASHVDANRNIAMIAIRFRDFQTAETALETVADDPEVAEDPELWIALGVARRGLRKFDAAEQAYRRALAVDASDPRPWFNLGVLAQDHLSGEGEVEVEELVELYETARTRYEKFIAAAGDAPRWKPAVREAGDRIVIIDDAITTIENMKVLEEEVRKIEAAEAAAKNKRIQDLLEAEKRAQGVGDPA